MDSSLVRIILGSKESDRIPANMILEILREIGIPYKVGTASCHWHTGVGLEDLIRGIEENLLALIGGLQFNIPSIAKTILKTSDQAYKLVLAVPTDKIAMRANQDFPAGTVIFMAGFNSISPKAGYINSALGIAELVAFRYPNYAPRLQAYYDNMAKEKKLANEFGLTNGLIPEPEK